MTNGRMDEPNDLLNRDGTGHLKNEKFERKPTHAKNEVGARDKQSSQKKEDN